jgi:hypothetical protein
MGEEVNTTGLGRAMMKFTIQLDSIPDDDEWRPVAAYRATIAEDPRFVHAIGICPAEALGHALLYLNRIADLRTGVRLDIRSLQAPAASADPAA